MSRWTPGDVAAIITNPFYAIQFDPTFGEPHNLLVDEDTWVAANVEAIITLEAGPWLRLLLSTLKSPAAIAPSDDTSGLIANPYSAVEAHPVLAEPHETLISEGQWIAANVSALEETGPEPWLRNLLVILKGTTLVEPDAGSPTSSVGRNDPCPCGSGLKYKRCHGA